VLLALELSGAPAALADGRGTDLASPALPTATAAAIESHHDDGGEHGDGPRLDLLATTLVPLAVGGAMHLDLLAGFFLRVQASVVVPAYVDAINDVGQGYGVWDDGTASAISGLLVDAVIFEGAVGVRPGGGPLELSVAYFMFWREGSAPAMMGLGARPLSVTVYAVHPELTLRMPLTDVLVMRVSLGWVHAVGTDARLGRLPEDGEAEDAARSAAESTIASWPAEYGMGPTLSASVGIHFE
jgi:hypothetical protein